MLPINRVYDVPGKLFQVPTGYVWLYTARLVTGKGLPPMAKEWAIGAAVLFAILTALRISNPSNSRWQALIPGGIAVAVGWSPRITIYPGCRCSYISLSRHV
jgi:uncharacterized oligopeptide transporter (OPT) family protein